MNTQMKEYRKATLRLAYLLTLMLWTGSCIDMDINRNPYETTQDELMRENHIIGSSLKSMEALVVPTQEHLYQFVEAMCGGAYGRYFGETRVGWTEKYSTYNPKSDWLKASFSDPISEMYPSYRDIINRTNTPSHWHSPRFCESLSCTGLRICSGRFPIPKYWEIKRKVTALVLLMTLKRRFMWLCSRTWKKQMKL